MKKNLIIAVGTALTLTLVACGGNQTTPNGNNTAETIESNNTSGEGNVELPNPFVEYDSIEEAEEAVGFDIAVPDTIDGYPEKIIRALITDDSKMIEVIYRDDEKNEIRIRKAPGSEDISGDYNKYEQSSQLTVDGMEVTAKGNGETVNLATWVNDDFTYSVTVSDGITGEDLSDLIASIR